MKRLTILMYSYIFLYVMFAASVAEAAENSAAFPFMNPALSIEERVDDLLSRMTLEEKVSQLVNGASAIERLGIPGYNWWNECLHGVARAGKATVYPQAIGLAATWDTYLMRRVAVSISDEARAKHHEFVRKGKRGIYTGLTFWSPNINIFRDPRWGRGMETYGEDPYLTGRMGIEFVRGLQGDNPKYLKVVATVKHYAVHSGPEPARHTFDARVSQRDLWTTYLPHFEMCVEEGNAYSAMGAYNRFMGVPCNASTLLLEEILREKWGFAGYVVSDCGAINDIHAYHKYVRTPEEAAALAVKAGCDLNCGMQYMHLVNAVEKGFITENEIDVSVRRLFEARLRLGMFDPPEMVPYSRIPYNVVDSPEHRNLAIEAARKSIVLLKNEDNLLPLSKDLRKIAVIGPNADDVEVLLGNYNGIPTNPVTPLEGIRRKVEPQTEVIFAPGCPWAENLPRMEIVPREALTTEFSGETRHGLTAEYYNNRDFNGDPSHTRVDAQVNFNWWDGAPYPEFDDDNFGVRWRSKLRATKTGIYAIGGNGFSGFRIFFEGKRIVQFESTHEAATRFETVFMEEGKEYDIRLECWDRQGDAHMRLLWAPPGRDFEKEAIEAARRSDVVVMCMGLSPRLEGEEMRVDVEGFSGGDRLTLDLPAIQERLIQTITRMGKPVVLVLLNGSAVSINWADEHVPAIVEAWYPGQAAGTAIADVLFGDYNPAGRLPVTFYRSERQLPPFEEYHMEGRTYKYFRQNPLYPFGHGLSYTTFSYDGLGVPEKIEPGENATITVRLKNTGDVAGEEVVELYLTDESASVPVPIRSLAGFQRVFLEPGEECWVAFTIEPGQMAIITDSGHRVIEPGIFRISVGGKQPGFSGNADARTTEVLEGRFEVVGERKEIK